MPDVIRPVPTQDEEFFWNGVAQGRLLLAQCANCGVLQHPPSPMCPNCGSTTWTTDEMSGRGTVHSWIVSHHPTELDERPRIVALIQLEEGFRLVSNVVEIEAGDIRNDMEVEVVFVEVDGVTLPQFRPVSAP